MIKPFAIIAERISDGRVLTELFEKRKDAQAFQQGIIVTNKFKDVCLFYKEGSL